MQLLPASHLFQVRKPPLSECIFQLFHFLAAKYAWTSTDIRRCASRGNVQSELAIYYREESCGATDGTCTLGSSDDSI
ncbi:uncharacterized protein LOC112540844 isoform X2 [Python bivittatus]|uniref:Uncharacterized protein LOC112540844 isoform X2 n=1 Tax=Python bivittatus TaxID=176946 RepID=A0A9F5MY65_PYTBI|nr:uncharacterized protein LOC112540844 isoform X2 [Python bivittatus]